METTCGIGIRSSSLYPPFDQRSTFEKNLYGFKPALTESQTVSIVSFQHQPACLILARQPLPTLDRNRFSPASGLGRGAYVLGELGGDARKLILIGTGSEVSLCMAVGEQLAAEGVPTRIVSMPSWKLFERQTEAYRESVLPNAIAARVAVEQPATIGWERYVGRHGAIVGMHTSGASAPLRAVLTKYGFTPEHVTSIAREQIARYAQ
jgi:transketolase